MPEYRLNYPSTVFSMNKDANILFLNNFQDIWIEWGNQIQSNLPLRFVNVSKNIPEQYTRHLFLDFENNIYDAIYISQNFVECVDYVLNEFKRRVLLGADTKDLAKALYFAEMFEDWNVDSILVLNKNMINVIEKV